MATAESGSALGEGCAGDGREDSEYTNVVGLPLAEVVEELARLGLAPATRSGA